MVFTLFILVGTQKKINILLNNSKQTTIYWTYKWKKWKKINTKSEYHYFEDTVNIEDFHSNLLEIDKKSHKDVDIYYIGYITIKSNDCENIHKMNPLYLIIHSATGYFKENYSKKNT